jgi:hypothetical protein
VRERHTERERVDRRWRGCGAAAVWGEERGGDEATGGCLAERRRAGGVLEASWRSPGGASRRRQARARVSRWCWRCSSSASRGQQPPPAHAPPVDRKPKFHAYSPTLRLTAVLRYVDTGSRQAGESLVQRGQDSRRLPLARGRLAQADGRGGHGRLAASQTRGFAGAACKISTSLRSRCPHISASM